MNSVALTTEASQHPFVFARAFNSFDPDELDLVYEAGAVLVSAPGESVTGGSLRAANGKLQHLGIPIAVRPRHCYERGELALLIVDWTISGGDVQIAGTATDVARRGVDGYWRYVIDNPHGVADLPGS